MSVAIDSPMTAPARRGRPEVYTREVLEHYAKHCHSMAETARQLGVDRSTVLHAARRHGVSFDTGNYGPKNIPVSAYRECAQAGLSQLEAARSLGVSRGAVSHMAKSYGIVFRDSRRAAT